MNTVKTSKISIIGAGFVGSTSAYALMLQGLCSEIVIVDLNKEKAEAEAMDLSHCASFVKPVTVIAGDYKDTANSDIIVITAGVAQKPGETRLDLINKNIKVFKDIVPQVVQYSPNSILLVVSNPVDLLTQIAYEISGFPKSKVIGSGTVLDSSRLKYLISDYFEIDSRDIEAYIIGEHGDSEIAAWSLANVAGMHVDDYCHKVSDTCEEDFKRVIPEKVKNAAYEIINKKGYTNYAIGMAVARIVESILRDENSILTVSSLFEGEYGINDIYMSIPTIVTRDGAKKIVEVPLSDSEKAALVKASEMLKKHIASSEL